MGIVNANMFYGLVFLCYGLVLAYAYGDRITRPLEHNSPQVIFDSHRQSPRLHVDNHKNHEKGTYMDPWSRLRWQARSMTADIYPTLL